MELYYFKDEAGNFGDDLNTWFWDAVLPGWRDMAPDRILVGVGSLINDKAPAAGRKVVLGSGVAYGDLPDLSVPGAWDFQAVRGPLSAQALHLPRERGIVDPAVLIADMADFRDVPRRARPILIPHHRTLGRHDWDAICTAAGIDHVSPQGDSRAVIRAIAGAPLVIAESMHAAILADAFRVPWTAVRIGHQFNDFKWQDWADSLGIDLRVHALFPELDRIARLVPRRPRRAAGPGASPGAGLGADPGASPSPRTDGRGAAHHRPLPTDWRLRARIRIESHLAIRNLRRLAAGPTQMSAPDMLEDRKARLRAVLAALPDHLAANLSPDLPPAAAAGGHDADHG